VRYDVLVLGGGSAGCVLAARLSEEESRTVCLVEAGPDYGPYEAGGWPRELLDSGGIPDSHEWDPDESPFSPLRAKVLGGCSAHNACLLVWPPDAPELEPYLRRALETIAPEPFYFAEDEFTPWFAGVAEACAEHGVEVMPGPYNIRDGVRWNAAFAYVDPARGRPNLTIRGDALVDRMLFEGERAVGAVVSGETVAADTVVLSAGACGSPAILLRSGVGPEAQLDALGIDVVAPLDAVGANLQDHASAKLVFEPSDELRERTRAQGPPVPFSNGIAKTDDLHVLPIAERTGDGAHLTVALLQPASRGRVRLRSADPAVSPEIDHRLLSDRRDRQALLDGLQLAHRLAATEALRRLGRPVELPDEQRIDTTLGIYFHPVGTCATGPVVDEDGRVHGFENLYVADASVLATIPRANTHLATLAVAEKVGSLL